MYWSRALSSVLVPFLLLATRTDITVAQPPAGQPGPPNGSPNQPPQSGPPPGPQASHPAPAQPGPTPGSGSAGNPIPGSTPVPAFTTGTFVAPTPVGSSTPPSSSISVNLTPFGGSVIPSVPGLSVNVTLSSTAGFPSLTGYPICVSQCLAIAASAANCSSVIAVNCYCANPLFTGTIVNCTARQCIGNLDLSQNLAQQYCNLAQLPAQLSFPSPPPMSSLPSTSIMPLTIVTGTAPPTSGGMKSCDGGRGAVLAFSVAFLGAVIGAMVVG